MFITDRPVPLAYTLTQKAGHGGPSGQSPGNARNALAHPTQRHGHDLRPSGPSQALGIPGRLPELTHYTGLAMKARKLLENAALGPEQLKTVYRAFDQAWKPSNRTTPPILNPPRLDACAWRTRC